jgi:putative sterol carrier protein
MASPDPTEIASLEPAAVYARLEQADEREFAALIDDPASHEAVVDALARHMAGTFRSDRAGDLDAVIHVKLWDKPGGGYDHLELVIGGGACVLADEPTRDPDLTLKVRPIDLRGILTGATGPRRLAMRGKLRVLGDLKLGMRLPELFAFDA